LFLYDVPSQVVGSLYRWESSSSGLFRKIRVRVLTLSGNELCWLYDLDGYQGGLPSARYLGLMADAAEQAGAPDDYVADLRTRPCRSIGPTQSG
jgi:hypothetical protein